MSLPESVQISSTDMTEEEVGKLTEQFLGKVPEGDRRKHDRLSCRKSVLLVLVDRSDGGASFMIQTENISRCGIAFKHSSILDTGTRCNVRIMLPSGGFVESEGSIVRYRPLQEGGYEVGLALERLLSVSLIDSQV